MTTRLNYIGSWQPGHTYKTADQALESLFEALNTWALDPVFEQYGNFASQPDDHTKERAHPGLVRFHGNFLCYSFAFSVDTDEPELVARLSTAIRLNQQRGRYQEARTPDWKHGNGCACTSAIRDSAQKTGTSGQSVQRTDARR